MVVMRELFAAGKLNAHQARPFLPTRPVEELYDLHIDPHELHNLAESSQHQRTLKNLRKVLKNWIVQSRDLGQIPEPILAEFLNEYDSMWAILKSEANQRLAQRITGTWMLGQRGVKSIPKLIKKLKGKEAPIRYVAAMGLGNLGEQAKLAADPLLAALNDKAGYVRVEAARALCLMNSSTDKAVAILEHELAGNDNEVVRHFAALALEDIGTKAHPAIESLEKAGKEKYEYVKRVSARVVNTLKMSRSPK
ncbi:MAG: HEAT repeat domain-containing protein [Planctomycetes bacterium]|nr:HEAT repeat domain-containing protein [Planctomycetota bacterium]